MRHKIETEKINKSQPPASQNSMKKSGPLIIKTKGGRENKTVFILVRRTVDV